MTTVILIWIFILAIILLSITTKCNMFKPKEGFHSLYGYYKQYCPSCGWRDRYSCSKCVNCGWCQTASGTGYCTPGDSSGPSFATDCMYWDYSDNLTYYPYSNIYPSIKKRSIYPYFSYRLRKPLRQPFKRV